MDQSPTRSVAERFEEAMREIGVLLIAFAPLEAAFSSGSRALTWLLLFLLVGLSLFSAAVIFERRRSHGH